MSPEAARIIDVTPEEEVKQEALTMPDRAKSIAIITAEDYTAAGEFLLGIKAVRKRIDETFDPIIDKAHQAHKEALAQKKKVEAPLIEAEGIIKPKIAEYNSEQERIRKEEERRLAEVARKEEEERRLAEAEAAEKAGDIAEAQAILDEPVYVPPVVVQKTTPKVSGIAMTTVWRFRITNEKKIPREYLSVDTVKIGGVVRALKDKCSIPGIQVYPEQSVRSGSR